MTPPVPPAQPTMPKPGHCLTSCSDVEVRRRQVGLSRTETIGAAHARTLASATESDHGA